MPGLWHARTVSILIAAIFLQKISSRDVFSCDGRPAGYYADLASDCQQYHVCSGGRRQYTYSCPNTTRFQQRMMICDHEYLVDCARSEQDFSVNLLIGQRGVPFVRAEELLPNQQNSQNLQSTAFQKFSHQSSQGPKQQQFSSTFLSNPKPTPPSKNYFFQKSAGTTSNLPVNRLGGNTALRPIAPSSRSPSTTSAPSILPRSSSERFQAKPTQRTAPPLSNPLHYFSTPNNSNPIAITDNVNNKFLRISSSFNPSSSLQFKPTPFTTSTTRPTTQFSFVTASVTAPTSSKSTVSATVPLNSSPDLNLLSLYQDEQHVNNTPLPSDSNPSTAKSQSRFDTSSIPHVTSVFEAPKSQITTTFPSAATFSDPYPNLNLLPPSHNQEEDFNNKQSLSSNSNPSPFQDDNSLEARSLRYSQALKLEWTLPDSRAMLYIPDNPEDTVLPNIKKYSVTIPQPRMNFRENLGANPVGPCPAHCNPAFIQPGSCLPCVVIK